MSAKLVERYWQTGRNRGRPSGAPWNTGLVVAPAARRGSAGRRLFDALKPADQQAVLVLFAEHGRTSSDLSLRTIESWRRWRGISYVAATSQVLGMLRKDELNTHAYRRERDLRQRQLPRTESHDGS